MEPLRGGNLVRLPEEAKVLLDQAEVRRTPAELALRWVWNDPKVSVALSGMTIMDDVIENLRVAEKAEADSLTVKEIALVEKIKDIVKEKTKVNCTACSYCMPCTVGINIPGCFSAYNDYWVFDHIPAAKQIYRMVL